MAGAAPEYEILAPASRGGEMRRFENKVSPPVILNTKVRNVINFELNYFVAVTGWNDTAG